MQIAIGVKNKPKIRICQCGTYNYANTFSFDYRIAFYTERNCTSVSVFMFVY